MNRFVLSLSALAAAAACSAQSPEEALRDEMMLRFGKVVPGSTFSPDTEDPLVVRIKGGEWDEGQINLHRIHQFCRNAPPQDCEATKAEFVTKLTRKAPEPTRDSLRLIVRDEGYVNYAKQIEGKGRADQTIQTRRIGEDLHAVLASDSPDATAIVTDDQLAKLGLTAEAAWALAERQTKMHLPDLPEPEKLAKQGVAYQGIEYGGSLLLDLQTWARISDKVGPDLAVTAVSDQLVFVTVMPGGRKLRAFAKDVVKDCEQQQRCLSPNIYRFRNGQWVIAQ